MGDVPEMFELTKQAGIMFQDNSTKAFAAGEYNEFNDEPLYVFDVFAELEEELNEAFASAKTTKEVKTKKKVETETTTKAETKTKIDKDTSVSKVALLNIDYKKRQSDLLENKDAIGTNTVKSPFSKDAEGFYLIETASQLEQLGKLIAEQVTFEDGKRAQFANYRLIKNLDLSTYQKQGWKPIGEMVRGGIPHTQQYIAFSGIFDGNNKTISNLTVLPSDEPYSFHGLFGFASGAEIRNLNLKNCDIKSNSGSAGGILGGSWNNEDILVSIVNCHASGMVSGDNIIGGTSGIAGDADYAKDCSFSGTVKTTTPSEALSADAGGILGSGNLYS